MWVPLSRHLTHGPRASRSRIRLLSKRRCSCLSVRVQRRFSTRPILAHASRSQVNKRQRMMHTKAKLLCTSTHTSHLRKQWKKSRRLRRFLRGLRRGPWTKSRAYKVIMLRWMQRKHSHSLQRSKKPSRRTWTHRQTRPRIFHRHSAHPLLGRWRASAPSRRARPKYPYPR